MLGAMTDLVVVDVVSTEAEAEIVCGLLRTAGVECSYRQTNFGAGASDGLMNAGPKEIVVFAEDEATAREALQQR
jgi:hypothetical protein